MRFADQSPPRILFGHDAAAQALGLASLISGRTGALPKR